MDLAAMMNPSYYTQRLLHFSDDPVQDMTMQFAVAPWDIEQGYIDRYIGQVFDQTFNEIWFRGIRPHLDKSLWLATRISEAGDDWGQKYQIDMRIREVQERPIVYKVVASFESLPRDVHACKFCGGYTYNDSRGNCAACGAPRGTT